MRSRCRISRRFRMGSPTPEPSTHREGTAYVEFAESVTSAVPIAGSFDVLSPRTRHDDANVRELRPRIGSDLIVEEIGTVTQASSPPCAQSSVGGEKFCRETQRVDVIASRA